MKLPKETKNSPKNVQWFLVVCPINLWRRRPQKRAAARRSRRKEEMMRNYKNAKYAVLWCSLWLELGWVRMMMIVVVAANFPHIQLFHSRCCLTAEAATDDVHWTTWEIINVFSEQSHLYYCERNLIIDNDSGISNLFILLVLLLCSKNLQYMCCGASPNKQNREKFLTWKFIVFTKHSGASPSHIAGNAWKRVVVVLFIWRQ